MSIGVGYRATWRRMWLWIRFQNKFPAAHEMGITLNNYQIANSVLYAANNNDKLMVILLLADPLLFLLHIAGQGNNDALLLQQSLSP